MGTRYRRRAISARILPQRVEQPPAANKLLPEGPGAKFIPIGIVFCMSGPQFPWPDVAESG